MLNDTTVSLARFGLYVQKEILLLPLGIVIYFGLCWLFGMEPGL